MMDYKELNKHVDAFTEHADVCTAKLREWHQQVVNVALLNLQRAYLQVRVSLGVSDSTDQRGEILPHAVGLRVKCSADDHEGYCQYSVGTRNGQWK